jgi:hypothetical protein
MVAAKLARCPTNQALECLNDLLIQPVPFGGNAKSPRDQNRLEFQGGGGIPYTTAYRLPKGVAIENDAASPHTPPVMQKMPSRDTTDNLHRHLSLGYQVIYLSLDRSNFFIANLPEKELERACSFALCW